MQPSHGCPRALRRIVAVALLAFGSTTGRAQVAWEPGEAMAGDWNFAAPQVGGGEEKRDATIPDNPQLTAPFVFGLGAMYVTNSTTEASKTTNGGIGGVVDFENVLGLKQELWVPFLSGRWRFADSFRLEAEYFSINRSATRTLGENIDWGGSGILAGTQVHSKFDFTDVRVSAGWSFYKTQDKEFGAALGLHVEDIRLDVSSATTSNSDESVVAPLPVLSVFGGFAMSEQWSISARFDAFKMTWDPYQGHLYDVGLDLVWNPWRHVGLGLGYRSLQLSGSFHATHYKGDLTAAYSGPILYLNVAF